ncbi:hypothetical protein SCOR_33250 [Sulfidibacter corallicola]
MALSFKEPESDRDVESREEPDRRAPPQSRFMESFRFGFFFGLLFQMTPFAIYFIFPRAWPVMAASVIVSAAVLCLIMFMSGALRVAAGVFAAMIVSTVSFFLGLMVMFR